MTQRAIARSVPNAQQAATTAATSSLQRARRTCQAIHITTDTQRFQPGGTVKVTITCTIRLHDLGLSVLPADPTTSATYTIPIDPNRGIQP